MNLRNIKEKLEELSEKELDKKLLYFDDSNNDILIEIKDIVICDDHVTLF